MNIDALPSVERDALALLLSGNNPTCRGLHSQLAHVAQVDRTETGAGVYVVFNLDSEVKPLQDRKTLQISGVFGASNKCGEIGFLLYIERGLIDCLEVYTYDDVFPTYSDCDFLLEFAESNSGASD